MGIRIHGTHEAKQIGNICNLLLERKIPLIDGVAEQMPEQELFAEGDYL